MVEKYKSAGDRNVRGFSYRQSRMPHRHHKDGAGLSNYWRNRAAQNAPDTSAQQDKKPISSVLSGGCMYLSVLSGLYSNLIQ